MIRAELAAAHRRSAAELRIIATHMEGEARAKRQRAEEHLVRAEEILAGDMLVPA